MCLAQIVNLPTVSYFCSEIRQKLKEDVAAIKEENVGFKPGLAIVQVWCLIIITELVIKKQC